MAIPMRDQIYDKIQTAGSLTDVQLSKALTKEEMTVSPDRFNKILLDLEIMGLINVAWMTKDTRRIEVARQPDDGGGDDGEGGSGEDKEAAEKDYEVSFPGADS